MNGGAARIAVDYILDSSPWRSHPSTSETERTLSAVRQCQAISDHHARTEQFPETNLPVLLGIEDVGRYDAGSRRETCLTRRQPTGAALHFAEIGVRVNVDLHFAELQVSEAHQGEDRFHRLHALLHDI